MQTIIKAILVNKLGDIEEFDVKATPQKYLLIKKRLEVELERAIKILSNLRDEGIIKSDKIPKNKKIQQDLNNLVRVKKVIKKSIKQLNELYK